jgi:aldehyde:ferredoxin oxidoreductase
MGLTAEINLSENQVKVRETEKELYSKFLGSRGYAAKILYDRVGPEVNPLDPENLLIFSTGPLTGTPWPTSARYTLTGKSPLTGIYGYSNSSGYFGPELKKAGFDALVFSGESSEPQVLFIDNQDLQLISADEYWGMTTKEVEDELKERFSGVKVASIGPAGENLVKFSSVVNDYSRTAARCGLGAVMGSKNLKAVAVRGEGEVDYSSEFADIAKRMMQKVGQHPGSKSLRKWGTAHLVGPKNVRGDLPTRNHQYAQFKDADQIDAKSLDEYVTKNSGCYSCPIACSRHSKVDKGKYKSEVEGPEYETMDSLGPLVGNGDLESIIHGNLLCNRLGIDTISTGVVIAFAMECHENGLLDSEDLSLEWGDSETVIQLIQDISHRQGLGETLAEGVQDAANKIGGGASYYAMHVKGMEMPRQEPRVCKSYGLAHSTSNRGADHLYALPTIDLTNNEEVGESFFSECMPEVLDHIDETCKPDMIVFTEAFNAISDALGVCKFSTTENFALYPEDLARGLSTFKEFELDGKALIKAGERIVNLERMYNHRHGIDRTDDQLPERILEEQISVYDMDTGEQVEEGLEVDLASMLDRYYELRGWTEDGTPKASKLEELELGSLIEDI